jgi:hypothetical protein
LVFLSVPPDVEDDPEESPPLPPFFPKMVPNTLDTLFPMPSLVLLCAGSVFERDDGCMDTGVDGQDAEEPKKGSQRCRWCGRVWCCPAASVEEAVEAEDDEEDEERERRRRCRGVGVGGGGGGGSAWHAKWSRKSGGGGGEEEMEQEEEVGEDEEEEERVLSSLWDLASRSREWKARETPA